MDRCPRGFSNGADPLYQDLKEHVGPFRWTAVGGLALAVDSPARAGPASSDPAADPRCWRLRYSHRGRPHRGQLGALLQSDEAEEDRTSRRPAIPARPWARARMFGQECNDALHVALVAALLAAPSYAARTPALLPRMVRLPSRERYFVASTWSAPHRLRVRSGYLRTRWGSHHREGTGGTSGHR